MSARESSRDPCPIVGITGVTPIRPVSIRRWPDGWVLIDLGGQQRRVILTLAGWTTVQRTVLPCCCWDFARGAAEVLTARYRGDDLPGWADRPGHPPMRDGATCPGAS